MILKMLCKIGEWKYIYIYMLYIFLTFLLGPFLRYLSQCKKGTQVLCVEMLSLLSACQCSEIAL